MPDPEVPLQASDFPVSRVPVVNVSEVPQRSPLRYPGGKTWLVPHIREWLTGTRPEILIEPFAGGAIVSLTAVMEDLVPKALLLELDADVAAFWRAALRPGSTLAERVERFRLTEQALHELVATAPDTVEEHGFRTLVLNRTRHRGTLAPGASFLSSGENGKGLLSRWYPKTLRNRLHAIQRHASRIDFIAGDGMKRLSPLLQHWGRNAAVFLDPPYSAPEGKRAGSRLYTHYQIDHEKLFRILAQHRSNFLMTYDVAPDIVRLVHKHRFHAVQLRMRNAYHKTIPELVITPEALFT